MTVDDTQPDEEELSEKEQQELIDELERKRNLRGIAAVAVAVIGICFSAFQMWLAARGFIFEVTLPVVGTVRLAALQQLQIRAIHVVFALILAFMLYPATSPDGAISRRLARVVPGLERRFGADHPSTRAATSVRSGVRWAIADPYRRRVTPVDLVLAFLAALTAAYMITDYDEVQTMRALGLGSGRTTGEIYPFLAPVVDAVSALGIPLDEVSYAFVLGAIGVLLVLEATRRTLGTLLMAIVSVFILYARYAGNIPQDIPYLGILSTLSASWDSVIQNLWYNTANGVFGVPVEVSVRYIYIFILFGAFLEMSGAGQWFIDLAYSMTGSRKGGPAKASILSSGFMGTISGSSIANTVTTGAFTIPLMKRSGYRPEFAGGVEASASSGGQILPPVMGAAAFLIVEFVGVSYDEVIIAAAIPAIVFFFGVWVMVHLEASRAGIGGVDPSELVAVGRHLRNGWFYLAPIVLLLVYLIGIRYSVSRSAWYTIVAIVALIALVATYNEQTRIPLIGTIVGLFTLETVANLLTGAGIAGALTGAGTGGVSLRAALDAAAGQLGIIIVLVSVAFLVARPNLKAPLLEYDGAVDDAAETTANAFGRPSLADNNAYRFGTFVLKAMESGARTATVVVVAVAAAGVIPGVISVSGLGPNLVALIEAVSGGSLILLLVITAISSIILGMGMPTTVTYIILVALLGGAISELANIPLLAAHLFILYFGVIADITPPVAVAAYAASGVAKSDPFKTGIEAFTLSLNKAIVPFAFVFAPGILLIRGESTEQYHILTFADVADIGYFVPEVAIPIVGLFLGVLALGPTIIGYFYSPVGTAERVLFGVSSILLMAPQMLLDPVFTLLAAGGTSVGIEILTLDLALRGVGAVLFGALALRNRRQMEGERAEPSSASPTTD
ncbi:C4-dicarboxylate ABC transporter permease [Haloprofundus marisrubri]|uniref:C4-dicarboxylate ABC transporter permease n=1 Tax=Haloprofundus marisrubri TaxID=1514971 RepID=A0A0W1RDY9_9EURY|nr:TRAP transporter fused permease subunit [Haloprofundus marisrubri]KTG11660.1 C4-dicarboxylate ABC transporter permease [Haloprofundus marisrubri]